MPRHDLKLIGGNRFFPSVQAAKVAGAHLKDGAKIFQTQNVACLLDSGEGISKSAFKLTSQATAFYTKRGPKWYKTTINRDSQPDQPNTQQPE